MLKKKIGLSLLLAGLLASFAEGKVFYPETTDELATNIREANRNGKDDIIDLKGCTFIVEKIYGGDDNCLPPIEPDRDHSLLVKNGEIDIQGVSCRHFQVKDNASLYLEELVLQGGNAEDCQYGGSILNNTKGSLFIEEVAFLYNNALYGGAIENLGNLSIGYATFAYNSANNSGGAIENKGTIWNLFNSTFAHNKTASQSGGVGGAIENEGTIELMTNNTIAYNYSSNPGGGIYNLGNIHVFVSNIVANNQTQSNVAPDISDAANDIINPSYNLVYSDDGNFFVDGVNNNIVGQDAGIGALSYNGGFVWTIPLLDASPAIGSGYNIQSLDWDARNHGYRRTSDEQTDIGAFEIQVCERDSDHDGVCNDVDNCVCTYNPGQRDRNHNGIGDACDPCPICIPHDHCDDTCGPCPPPVPPGPCDPTCPHCPRNDT